MHRLTDEYRLLRRLGSGGMGEVWEAVRIKSGGIVVPCAIKLLHGDFTETARERRLFFDEARIATQLDHSRIVKVVDLGTSTGGRPFLVMERVDGVDLRHFLKAASKEGRTPLGLDVVTYIVGEVLAALAYAHERTVGGSDAGIVHSDITPGNILVSSSGEVKLTDFGIARFAAVATPMSRAIGTPRYMSPEQLSGDPRRETDIYGLGVILHELLEGERFLDGLAPDQFRSRVLTGPPPELTRAGIPAWLDELRGRMIATDPKDRPQANEARAVLIEHCPRYLAAATQLEASYAQLIGRRRSGVTQLMDEGEGDTALLPPPDDAQDGGRPDAATPDADDEVEPTVLLPTTSVTEPSAAQVSASPPAMLRWLAMASGLAALVLMLVALLLLVKLVREPDGDAGDSREVPELMAAATPPAQAREPEPNPASVEAKEPEPPPPREPAPPSPAVAAEVEADPLELEPEPEPKAEPKPEPEPKPKPKPKAVTKVGVVFLVETNEKGQIKAGRKVVAVKNRSGYAELPPGRYKVSWRPEGAASWEPHGQVRLEDISPNRYKVRLDEGKIVEVGQL